MDYQELIGLYEELRIATERHTHTKDDRERARFHLNLLEAKAGEVKLTPDQRVEIQKVGREIIQLVRASYAEQARKLIDKVVAGKKGQFSTADFTNRYGRAVNI